MFFLTVHGIGGDDTTSQAEFTDEALDSRDFVGFVINLDMPEDQCAVRLEGAHQVTGLLVGKVVVAAAQGLAIEGDHAQALPARAFSQDLTMQAECPLNRAPVQPLQDDADRSVGWRAAPGKPEMRPQPLQMDFDEGMNATVRIRPRPSLPGSKTA